MPEEKVKYKRIKVEGRVHAKVVHLRTPDKGSFTIAYKSGGPGVIIVGIGFCAPNETFSRAKGRRYAEDRLYSNPIRFHCGEGKAVDPLRMAVRLIQGPTIASPENGPARGFEMHFKFDGVTAVLATKTLHIDKPFFGADWLGRTKPWIVSCANAIRWDDEQKAQAAP